MKICVQFFDSKKSFYFRAPGALAARAQVRLGAFLRSLHMPLRAGLLVVGVPLAIAATLLSLQAHHASLDVDWLYYPSAAAVYGLWILPLLGFMLLSFPQLQPNPACPPRRKFVCMVAAYNEREVIANPVRSLLAQDYPRELFEVWVIFDGNDDTGDIAERYGANVLVTPTNGFGKHRALKYAFETLLREDDDRYVAVFDADNVVSSNYLQAMNNAIESHGYRCLQAFHDVLNGASNWVTKALWCGCVSSSRMYLTGRMRLLKNALICGTGWCCEAGLLRKYWKQIRTQTEDIELNGILALEEGIGVAFVPECSIFDEKPLSIWVAIRQRMRWMAGHARVAFYLFWPCLRRGLARRDAKLLELAAYYLVPFVLLISFASFPLLAGMSLHVFKIAGPLASGPLQVGAMIVSFFFMLGYQFVAFMPVDVGAPNPVAHVARITLYSLYTLVFALLAWPPALVWALFSIRKVDWIFHTPHVAAVPEPTVLDQARAEKFDRFTIANASPVAHAPAPSLQEMAS